MGIEIVRIDTLDDLKAHVKATTAKVRDVEPAEQSAAHVIEDSELVKTIREECGNVDSDLRPIFSALVKAIDGRDVDFTEREDTVEYSYPRFSAIVPLSNPNDHTYPLEKAFIVNIFTDDGRARAGVKECGAKGNNHGGKWRYATDDEIDALFATFDESVLTKF